MAFNFGLGNNSSSTPNKPTFGAVPNSSGGTTPSLFSTANTATSSTNIFGGGGASSTPTSKPGNIFGGGALSGTSNTPSFSFGAASGSAPTATPATNKTSFLPSTTPAGAPPGPGLFGGSGNQTGGQSGGLFAQAQKPATTSAAPSIFGNSAAQPLGSSTSGSGLFDKIGASSDANNPKTPGVSAPSGGLFGAPTSSTPSSTPAKPLEFKLGSTPATTTTTTTTTTAAAATTTATATPSLSGNGTAPASSAPASGGLFAGAGSNAAAPTTGSSLFSWGKPPTSTPGTSATSGGTTAATSGPPTTAASATPLPSLGSQSSTAPAASATATSGTAPSLFAAKPASNEPRPSTSGPGANPTASMGNAANMASSTAGPAPSAQSRLKNKSMDEIITRWAADLSKYQKEFQQQAETVASWDRALVENSDKVRQLYSKTFQAERDAAEVERQLTLMEENQQELDAYLDRYEKDIDNLMKMHGVSGKSEGLRGPDQERERTYKLAEKLQDRLNELNKDLTEMIEEINTTSQTLSKTGKPDDPLTKVVRVLNTQLAQLQLIDSGAAQLQDKISQAKKESQGVGRNGWNGLGSDPTEDFYRSLRGSRSERFGGVS